MNTPEPRVDELTPQQVVGLLNSDRILLLDVREPHEYAEARIPGATSCPLSSFDPASP
jgi:rhodanese-related sulfurtransferase